MNKRRKRAPKLTNLTAKSESDCRCWYCGSTMNVPVKKHDGMCMSCFFDFHEDDITLELFGMGVMS
jgi:hypothetical protein